MANDIIKIDNAKTPRNGVMTVKVGINFIKNTDNAQNLDLARVNSKLSIRFDDPQYYSA